MQGVCSVQRSRAVAALAGSLLLGLLLSGCADDGASDTVPTEIAATPTAQSVSALPLERFHYVASLTLREERPAGEMGEIVVSTEGDVQAPDRHAFTYSIKRGDAAIERSVVIVGEQAWFRQGDGPWAETTTGDPKVADLLSVAVSGVRPGFLGGAQLRGVQESVRRLPSTRETVNGVIASHYRVGPAGQEYFEAFLANDQLLRNVRDLKWDLWLAEEGAWPVRLLASGSIIADLLVLDELDVRTPASWELRIDVSRPNDPTLAVVPPED